jgi:hypothetical protein
MGEKAGRWLEKGRKDGGMEGWRDGRADGALLDVTARWRGEPVAKWIKRLRCPRGQKRARQTEGGTGEPDSRA